MRIFCFDVKIIGFSELTGISKVQRQIEKFRELRDSYRAANRAHYGEYLASLLDD